ncbi:hypothetical protein F4778DRAFT_405881 [Xylariomycetidae sp. FL2044]|nr:hypothetical protein F4778DRAFT_405881 [Xylariomycetidae sp. FL2044]
MQCGYNVISKGGSRRYRFVHKCLSSRPMKCLYRLELFCCPRLPSRIRPATNRQQSPRGAPIRSRIPEEKGRRPRVSYRGLANPRARMKGGRGRHSAPGREEATPSTPFPSNPLDHSRERDASIGAAKGASEKGEAVPNGPTRRLSANHHLPPYSSISLRRDSCQSRPAYEPKNASPLLLEKRAPNLRSEESYRQAEDGGQSGSFVWLYWLRLRGCRKSEEHSETIQSTVDRNAAQSLFRAGRCVFSFPPATGSQRLARSRFAQTGGAADYNGKSMGGKEGKGKKRGARRKKADFEV